MLEDKRETDSLSEKVKQSKKEENGNNYYRNFNMLIFVDVLKN